MSLFKRSVVSEILGHAGVIFSTLLVVWLSVLLVRLLGEAANGSIGADVVFGHVFQHYRIAGHFVGIAVYCRVNDGDTQFS